MEELHSGLAHREGFSGNTFGDLKGKSLVKNSLYESQYSRNQLQQKLSIALPLGAFSPPQSSSTPKHPGYMSGTTPKHPGSTSGRAEVAVVRPTQVIWPSQSLSTAMFLGSPSGGAEVVSE